MPQNPDVLRGNVLEAIKEIFSSKINNSTNFSTQKLKELMSYFNLQDSTLTKDFSELSGGEKQRIAIIISILLDREIFLLDEPTASLDEELKEKTVDFFSKQKNKIQLVISHDPQWEKLENVKIMEV